MGAQDCVALAAERRWALRAAIACGFAASLLYFSWWWRDARLASPPLLSAFVLALGYVVAQVYCAWYVYLRITIPTPRAARAGLAVDVFVPVYDEPLALVERSVAAAVAMRYPHTTYLLDDAGDPRLATLASRLGAIHLQRADRAQAKAGNVNAALARSRGELVTVFDVDHVPQPEFLDVVLGHFDDPTVGFVQSRVAFANADESFVAATMAEQAADAYGPTSAGMHGCGAAPLWGSHCTFRRAALDAIGGHQAGLAEDLHTSLRLHAAGWRSVFVPTICARGLTPRDLVGAVKQQLKWSRGVFEMLVEVYPRLWRRLSPSQSAAYVVRMTYYLVGPLFLAHALVAALVLLGGDVATRRGLASYVLCAAPLGCGVVLVRHLAAAGWADTPRRRRLGWRSYAFASSLWPIYTLALACALLRVRIPHLATPKERSARPHPYLVVPQAALIAVLLAAVVARCAGGLVAADVVLIPFALAACATQATAVYTGLTG